MILSLFELLFIIAFDVYFICYKYCWFVILSSNSKIGDIQVIAAGFFLFIVGEYSYHHIDMLLIIIVVCLDARASNDRGMYFTYSSRHKE